MHPQCPPWQSAGGLSYSSLHMPGAVAVEVFPCRAGCLDQVWLLAGNMPNTAGLSAEGQSYSRPSVIVQAACRHKRFSLNLQNPSQQGAAISSALLWKAYLISVCLSEEQGTQREREACELDVDPGQEPSRSSAPLQLLGGRLAVPSGAFQALGALCTVTWC